MDVPVDCQLSSAWFCFRSNLAHLAKILSDKSVYSLISAVVVDSMIWIDFEAYMVHQPKSCCFKRATSS